MRQGGIFAAAGLYALDPWEAYWTPFVLKESVAVPLMLVAVGASLRAREARTPASALVAGVACLGEDGKVVWSSGAAQRWTPRAGDWERSPRARR